eukprot:GHUV01029668.1.p2 GENE.GHUV01029668.1~~GHUV01029668.1.p2  ORF type:complete len:119 (+),score=1.26 GHUV01029668.1:361-717(+)
MLQGSQETPRSSPLHHRCSHPSPVGLCTRRCLGAGLPASQQHNTQETRLKVRIELRTLQHNAISLTHHQLLCVCVQSSRHRPPTTMLHHSPGLTYMLTKVRSQRYAMQPAISVDSTGL